MRAKPMSRRKLSVRSDNIPHLLNADGIIARDNCAISPLTDFFRECRFKALDIHEQTTGAVFLSMASKSAESVFKISVRHVRSLLSPVYFHAGYSFIVGNLPQVILVQLHEVVLLSTSEHRSQREISS